MTREEIIDNLANEIDEELTACERAEHLLDCDYCHLKKKNGTCNIGHHIAECQISIVKKAQTDLLKEFVEWFKNNYYFAKYPLFAKNTEELIEKFLGEYNGKQD